VDAVFALAGPSLLDARAVLDVGCGSGWWLERLALDARVSAALHGVELLAARAAAAHQRVPSARIETADARQLPYDDASFDAVTLLTVLSSLAHTADAERALSEARRVLRPGGALLIWEPRVINPLNSSTVFVGRRAVRRALAEDALESRTTTVFPPLARRLGSRTERLYPVLLRINFLRTHRLVCARRRVPTPSR
jgi:ubiquinone/menaquinone biosynthesis C-methylase UbiE